MKCREGCGACCIAPSISSPIPGMPNGKPAGERCVQLSVENLCSIFGQPGAPGGLFGVRGRRRGLRQQLGRSDQVDRLVGANDGGVMC